ncbi:alpha/beta-hydrolase [Trametes gibbosa]|nr:alpha/beta-hydrolase [Trametes gibbosa]
MSEFADPYSERPFTLAVPDVELELLRKRLDLVRLPDELDGAAWHYGAARADVARLVAHWRGGFDWRAREAAINALPMFVRGVEVEGFGTLEVHYVHRRSGVEGAIPLLFVHGWPGSFLEARKLLPLLTAGSPEYPSFHVVAVSLPGFGFSEAPKKPGFAGPQYAEVFNKLMLALGYDEYVYQGGDWGHMIGVHAVHIYGHKHIKAWLTNLPIYRDPTLFTYPVYYLQKLALPITTRFNDRARIDYEKTKEWYKRGTGYYSEQATEPQTVGYSLADSPVGLLAWIYEKLVTWTDHYPWTDDEVLEWISVYWFSRAGPAAASRVYYEMTGGYAYEYWKGSERTSVPLGASYFPAELTRPPKQWLNMLGKVVFQSEHDRGGHFAAFEQPELLAGDLRKMFGKGGPAYGVVPGKDGYN